MKNLLFIVAIGALMFSSCTKSDDPISDKSYGDRDGESFYETGGSGGESGTGGGDTIQSGQITAAEWNDLANWDFFLNLGQNDDFKNMPEYWTFNLANRISIKVQNMESSLMKDIPVELLSESNVVILKTRTDNFGTAEFFPSEAGNYKVRINGNPQLYAVNPFSLGINSISIELSQSMSKKADIAFVVDATGSMGDELEFLKVELIDVIGKVKESNPGAAINLGSVFYRDTDDEYVTRISQFSADIDHTVNFIKEQSSNGGGDFPEAVEIALKKAVNDLQWSSKVNARIIFLVLDAPPHHDADKIAEIHKQVALAAEKGIKIIPVVASGIDKETEFLMRFMSISTNGTYVFITNDSGIGNDHLIPTVGQYEVELLNDLITRLINKNLE